MLPIVDRWSLELDDPLLLLHQWGLGLNWCAADSKILVSTFQVRRRWKS
jgi:hypothetical protein